MKSSEVSIKTRLTPASLSFKGQATRHTTVKWSTGVSPPPPTSSLSPCLCNLVLNKMLLSCGEKQIDLLITFSAGPGFISMSPDSKSFISDAEYCLLLKFFQQFLCACDDRDRK